MSGPSRTIDQTFFFCLWGFSIRTRYDNLLVVNGHLSDRLHDHSARATCQIQPAGHDNQLTQWHCMQIVWLHTIMFAYRMTTDGWEAGRFNSWKLDE